MNDKKPDLNGGKNPRNMKGQSLGTKGDRSRQRIMDTAFGLLKVKNVWDISVTDICAACEIAPSNLYTYFKGVDDVVLGLSRQIVERCPPLVEIATGEWAGRAGLMRARRFVKEAFIYWDEYRPVLKVIELFGDEGSPEFGALRAERLLPVYEALTPVVMKAKKDGYLHKKMDAGIVVISAYGLIEAAAMHVPQIIQFGYDYDKLLETHARMLIQHLTGKSA
jgi:AcrR family transcriptional regulator